jgi:hypothetical protein
MNAIALPVPTADRLGSLANPLYRLSLSLFFWVAHSTTLSLPESFVSIRFFFQNEKG